MVYEAHNTTLGSGGESLGFGEERLLTFGAALGSPIRWQLCGCWSECTRDQAISLGSGNKRKDAIGSPPRAKQPQASCPADNETPMLLSEMHKPGWLSKGAAVADACEQDNTDILTADGGDAAPSF